MKIIDPVHQDQRLVFYRLAIDKLKKGEYKFDIPTQPLDDVGCIGQALQELASSLEQRALEQKQLDRITATISSGITLEEVLENIYRDFKTVIPYNRIGLALISEDGKTARTVWGKSDQPEIRIDRGYTASLAGSSLEKVIKTRQPRIINDLLSHLKSRPQSESTHLIVAEGIRSSLTCPLIVSDNPVGFLFFSSTTPNTYQNVHVDIFKRLAEQVSFNIERGRLVSELTASKKAIEAQNDELRRLNDAKNEFLGIAAHDLRSPLSQIQLASSLLLSPEPWLSHEERQSLLETFFTNIEAHTRNMLDLLNNLLDVSQIEAGKLSLKFETVELRKFLEEAAAAHTLLAAGKGIRVVLTEAPPENIVADPHRLRQVLDNLISNAVKFSPSGSQVLIGARRKHANWIISVQDEGPGITEEARQHIFQEYEALSAWPTLDEKSVGLGLAITRRVVEAHGGQIGVDSLPQRGARFWFSLPY